MKIPTTAPVRWFARLSLITILLAPAAHATSGWWGGGGSDTLWGTVGNWKTDAAGSATVSAVPGSGDTATFNTTALSTPVLASIGTSTLALAGFAFNSAGTVGINASGSVGSVNTTITLGSGGITMGSSAGNVTFANGATTGFRTAFTLGAAQSWINNNSASTLNISGSGTGNDIANGGFLLSFSGNGPINIASVISGTGGINKAGAATFTLTLSGLNTFTGASKVGAGILSVNTIGNVGSPSSLGAPAVANSTINFGGTATGVLAYTGSATTTDRGLNITGTSGGGTIDQSGSGLLKFSSGVTSTGSGTVGMGSHTLTLQGSTTGTGEIGGAIVDNGTVGTTANTAAIANGNTTVTLASVDGVVNGASISGTGIPTGDTVASFVASTKVVTLASPATGAAAVGSTMTVAGVKNITSLTKAGTGTWTLSGAASTYTGPTTISAGTLALSGSGSIASTPKISIAAGATFDVSAITPTSYTITGASPVQTLAGSSTSGTATINATGKTLTLNSGALLSFLSSGTASTVGKISVTGNLTLNNNAVTVNVSGSALAAGTYTLMDCTGTLTGSANSTPTMTGTALKANYTATIVTDNVNKQVNLVVKALPVFSGLTASQSITYGTANVTLSGVVSSATGPVYPADGETVSVTINGVTQPATISGGVGAFSVSFPTATIPYSATVYTITYAYGGNATTLQAAASVTSTKLTVSQKPLTITATGPSKTYGTALSAGTSTVNFTAGATGVGSETVTSVTLTPDAAGLSATTAAGSAYVVTPSLATGTGGFLAANYNITYNPYNGTVTPTPGTFGITTTKNTAASFDTAKIIYYGQSGGPTMTVTAVATTTSGATVGLVGTTITYTPATGSTGADSFTYTLSAGGATSTGTVNVTINDANVSSSLSITVNAGLATVTSSGIPSQAYTVQKSDDNGSTWSDYASKNAEANGFFTYTDTDPVINHSSRMYRLKQP